MNVGISLEMLIPSAKNLLFQQERPGKILVLQILWTRKTLCRVEIVDMNIYNPSCFFAFMSYAVTIRSKYLISLRL